MAKYNPGRRATRVVPAPPLLRRRLSESKGHRQPTTFSALELSLAHKSSIRVRRAIAPQNWDSPDVPQYAADG